MAWTQARGRWPSAQSFEQVNSELAFVVMRFGGEVDHRTALLRGHGVGVLQKRAMALCAGARTARNPCVMQCRVLAATALRAAPRGGQARRPRAIGTDLEHLKTVVEAEPDQPGSLTRANREESAGSCVGKGMRKPSPDGRVRGLRRLQSRHARVQERLATHIESVRPVRSGAGTPLGPVRT